MAQTAILAQNDNLYQRVIKPSVGRSAFDLSHSVTTDIDFGQLMPVCCIPTVPSDSFEISNAVLIKQLSALKVPIMARFTVATAYYWCDNRLAWKKWDRFITKGRSGTEVYEQPLLGDEDTGLPAISSNSELSVTLRTQFNLTETAISPDDCPTAYSWYDYQIICRDFYTNVDRLPDNGLDWTYENLFPADPDDFKLVDGYQVSCNGVDLTKIRYHNVREDYFTSSLKAPLRGNEPTIHLAQAQINNQTAQLDFTDSFVDNHVQGAGIMGGSIGVKGDTYIISPGPSGQPPIIGFNNAHFSSSLGNDTFSTNSSDGNLQYSQPFATHGSGDMYNYSFTGYDLDNLAKSALGKGKAVLNNIPVTVNSDVTAAELTLLSQLTTFQTLNMIAESNYNSQLNAHFENVTVGESAVEKPQFIGGTTQYININEITQTTGSSDSQLGYQGATANSFGTAEVGKYFCNDYGFIIGIAYIIPDLLYKPAIPRYFNYKTPEEYYWPEFSNIAMQAILNKEIFNSNSSEWNNLVFGYQGRYDELRSIPNRVQSRLCGTEQDIKNFVLMREFDNSHKPEMSSSFLSLKDNVNKTAWNVPLMPPFIMQVANYIKAYRPMPYVAVPKYL